MRVPFTRKQVNLRQLFTKYLGPMVASTSVELTTLVPGRRGNGTIVLFGHDLNGNLEAFRRYLATLPDAPTVLFMTDSAATWRRLRANGDQAVLYSGRRRDLVVAAMSDVIVTSHGPINLIRWPRRHNRPVFVDLSHGIGYKIDGALVRSMARYDAHFVASELVRQAHIGFGVEPERVVATGFARTDQLVGFQLDAADRVAILSSYGLDPQERRPIVLFAPTWNQHRPQDVMPFGMSAEEFVDRIDAVAGELGALVVFRLHLNSSVSVPSTYANVVEVPARVYPEAEPLLKVSDVLITDWSSIISEFLVLRRPIIFVEKPPPFDGPVAPLGPSDRPGAIVGSWRALVDSLTIAVRDPADYMSRHRVVIDSTTERAWGASLDGLSAQRYWAKITRLRAERKANTRQSVNAR